ncbi:hypothetical protein D1007_28740 [Hordeum vulgare]|nr:hypothetical protein D1007_28740 [Hordeum vulgare]
MSEGVLHIQDVEGTNKEGSEKNMLATMEHEILKCQGTVERELNVNRSMITNFICEHKMDIKEIVEMIFKLVTPR